MNADPLDYLTADMAADAPVEALTADGRVLVTGAVWEASTGLLERLQREVDTWRNLHPDMEVDDDA